MRLKKNIVQQISWFGIDKFYKYLPSFLVKKIKSIFIRKIFIISKGYNILKKRNNLDVYHKLITDFETSNFNIDEKNISSLIIDSDLSNKNEKIKQFVQHYFFSKNLKYLSLTRSVLFSLGKNKKLIFPIAPQSLFCFEKNNILINNKKSVILWYLFVIIFYFFGLYKILRLILIIIKNFLLNKKTKFDKSAFFNQVPADNLSFANEFDNTDNYFSFFINFYNKDKQKIYNICHGVNSIKKFKHKNINFFKSDIYHPYLNFFSFLNFLFWSFKAISLSFFDIFRGRWWHALMLSQSAERYVVKLIDQKYIHDLYLFNNTSGHAHRPLWTYEVEKKYSKVIFYFYSLNYSIISADKKYKPPGLLNSNWTNYFVWNKLHEEQLNNYCKYKFNIIATSPTLYTSGSKKFIKPKQKFLTVFDTSPLRKSFYKSLLLPSVHHSTEVMIIFLTDILDICKKYNFKLILKIKGISSQIDKKYLYFVKKFIKNDSVILFDHEISSISLIQQSQFIISYPFTSTNHLASYFNINNCFYNPSNEYILDKDLAFGSKIIYKKNELEQTICETFKI